MRWVVVEYVLKGIFLGLLVYVGLQEPDWADLERVIWLTLGGLALCLGISAAVKLREGYSIKGRVPAFILFLLLESPELVYIGVVLGMAFGAVTVPKNKPEDWLLVATVMGGGVLGYLFSWLPTIENRWTRFTIILALAVALGAAAVYFLPDYLINQQMFGVLLILGMLVFYLLTFAGRAEESEVEIGAMCAMLGIGFRLLELTPQFQSMVFLVPLGLYYWYTTRVLPGLRVFKHAMRGLSYAKIGQHQHALFVFQRALELDPENKIAREGLWTVHRAIDWTEVAKDQKMLDLVNFDLCMSRVSTLLSQPPTPAVRDEAMRLLDLVLQHRPRVRPIIQYWRAVAHMHDKQFAQAAEELASVLDPTDYDADDPHRRSILLPCWQVALTTVAEIKRLVGDPQLVVSGRRMEAIAAVERHLEEHPGDPAVKELKGHLYRDLNLESFLEGSANGPPRLFDYRGVEKLGRSLLEDPARWKHGTEYLHMAALGTPVQAPALLVEIAHAYENVKDEAGAWKYYEMAQDAGKSVGPKTLSDEARQAYFQAVKHLADTAAAKGDLDVAIENYHLYTDYERSGLETLRILADLYEKKEQPLNCLRIIEHALIYDAKDKDLLERKDKYYYSVQEEDLKSKLEGIRKLFDVAYCLKKARSVFEMREADPELYDWALHLLKLTEIVEPKNMTAKLLRARAHLALGERDEGLRILEDVWVAGKPAKFAGGEDEESWQALCQRLGTMYLRELSRPDLAIPCLVEFKSSPKAGADTLFKLGESYEQTGDFKRAAHYYEQVTAYDTHPLAPDAQSALYRMQAKIT